jgi:hypothetical protein
MTPKPSATIHESVPAMTKPSIETPKGTRLVYLPSGFQVTVVGPRETGLAVELNEKSHSEGVILNGCFDNWRIAS